MRSWGNFPFKMEAIHSHTTLVFNMNKQKNKKSSKNRKLSLTKCSETHLKAQSCVCIKTYFNISLQAIETINPTGFCCCSFPGTDLRWSLKALFGEA